VGAIPVDPLVKWSWISANGGMIESALAQHAELSALAIGIGLLLSVPLAVLAWHHRRFRAPLLGVTGLLYTVPSVALFALIQPLTGYFSVTTAEVALVSYTLLILVRNTLAGLDAVPAEVREASVAMGYSTPARILRVDLPLALPAIFAGLRVATVTTVGLVTVTAFIGEGGLGQLIINGFEQNGFHTEIVTGLVLSIALAAVGDLLVVGLERATVRWSRVSAGRSGG